MPVLSVLLTAAVVHAAPEAPVCGLGVGRPFGGLFGASCALTLPEKPIDVSLGLGYRGVTVMGHRSFGATDVGLGFGYGAVAHMEPVRFQPSDTHLAVRVRSYLTASLGTSSEEEDYAAGLTLTFLGRDDGQLTWVPGVYAKVFSFRKGRLERAAAPPVIRRAYERVRTSSSPAGEPFQVTGRGPNDIEARRNAQERALAAYLERVVPPSAWKRQADVLATMFAAPGTYVASLQVSELGQEGREHTCRAEVRIDTEAVRSFLRANGVELR